LRIRRSTSSSTTTAPLASMYALPVPFDEEEEGVDDSKKYNF
jgi:hypothetical protein